MVDISFLEELDRFKLVLKKRVNTQYQGLEKSAYTGEGLVFKDHKQYVPGDDFRYIDWNVYGRTEELFVKQFEAERSETFHILVDSSASMDFGSPQKFEYAAKIGLGLAYLANKEQETFHLSTFSNKLDIIDGKQNVVRAVDHINHNTKIQGKTAFKDTLYEYLPSIRSKSMVFIISDFLFPGDEVVDVLTRYRKNDVVLIPVLAQEEVKLDISGEHVLEDSETSEQVKMYVSERLKREYRSRLRKHLLDLEEIAEQYRASYIPTTTGDDIFNVFIRILNAVQTT